MKRLHLLVLILVLAVLSTACETVVTNEQPPLLTPNSEAIEAGWHRLCDGCRFTARQGKEFVCANSFEIDNYYMDFYHDLSGQNETESFRCDKPILIINASGGSYIYDTGTSKCQ